MERWSRAVVYGTTRRCALILSIVVGTGCSQALDLQELGGTTSNAQAPHGDMDTDAGSTTTHQGLGRTPTISISSPRDGQTLRTDRFIVEGTAADDRGIASVFVRTGPNAPALATTTDNWRTWRARIAAPPGPFAVTAVAIDTDGLTVDEPAKIRLSRPDDTPDAQRPSVTITSPERGATLPRSGALLRGATTDDRGVTRVDIFRNGVALRDRDVSTDNFFATWSHIVELPPGEASVLRVVATDASGNTGEDTITLFRHAEVDRTPPTIEVTSPLAGDTVDTDTLRVMGSAADSNGVREVRVRVGRLIDGELSFSPFTRASTADGWATWGADIPASPGALTVDARATDLNGLTSKAVFAVTNRFQPEWSTERLFFLRLRDAAPPTVQIRLDRAGIDEIFPAELQRDVLLLELDPTALLTNSLTTIKHACGSSWMRDAQDPMHDCSTTPLGRTFTGPDGTWQSSPEYALVRLLTMTPANVVVEGTSVAGLKSVANGAILGIKIGGGFNEILASMLSIQRTDEIVDTASVVHALRTQWLATHPNTGPMGELPITLYDAMQDLTPLGATLGPAPPHPGVTDPARPPRAALFEPGFRMTLQASSNLQWLDGLDLSGGKDYSADIVDTTGPTFGDVLEFDFTDPQRFHVDGLVPDPRIDLRFAIAEDDAFISSCNGRTACKANLPTSPVGADYVWSTGPWTLERIVAEGARTKYAERRFRDCYIHFLGCRAEVAMGQGNEPAGWTQFDIVFNLGDPPKDQYVWELISEVAQVALHRIPGATIPEGDADVAFTVEGVRVGVTADQLREAIRPYLQDQASLISQRLLGDWSRNNGAVDLTWRRAPDATPYLFFTAREDPRPLATYDYTRPGFFADPELTVKLSTEGPPGAPHPSHEVWSPPPGDSVVYARDDLGDTYRLRLSRAVDGSDELTVLVSRHMR
ncbi:MAG: Ig-like domain-containing protein [Myxococcota bacterium]